MKREEWKGNTTAAGDGISYAPGGMLYRNADTVLYAIWQPIAQTWTVTYHANGGSGAPSAQTKTENAPLSLSDGIPTRTGYRFLGWATAADAERVAYLPGAVYSGNAALVLYAVWEPKLYRITYHPNGGADAPDAQEKLHDTVLTLRQEIPTRNNYRFLGWSTVQDATVPEFLPGDRYTEEGDRTLYAVWEFINYDFSVSDLSVSSDTVYQYDTVTVRCRLDNWDPKNGYSRIPVEILLDGVLLWQTEVEFAAYGAQFVTFTLRVGALVDTHTLTARVNWEKHGDEVRSGNNETSVTLTVRQVVSVYSNAVTPNAGYLAGCEAVTAFLAHNNTATPLMPEDGVSFLFEVYRLDDAGREVLLERQTWERVVVPANGKNLVWFRWTVPADAVGSLLWCRGTANPEGLGNETDRTDNSDFFTVTPKAPSVSALPDARYEKQFPESYDPYAARPESTPGRAVWNQWCCENGELVLKTYGVRVGGADPSLTADPACPSAKVESGMLYMKSGYGILLSWPPTVVGDERYEMPDAGSYTQAQNAYVRFPETGYSAVYGCYQTLEYSGGAYRFPSHPNAAILQTYRDFGMPCGDGKQPILADLLKRLQSLAGTARIVHLLERFVSGSARNFNQQTNVDRSSSYVVLDLSGLDGKLLAPGMMIALDLVWSRVKADKSDAYEDYALYGGMPLVLFKKTDDEKYRYLSSLFEEVYFRDITERYRIAYPDVLSELTDDLCSSVGSLTNVSKITNTIRTVKGLKVDENTVASYLTYLSESFLFCCAKRYDVKGKRYFSYPSKYYCTDIGLRNIRLNFRQQEETHIMKNMIYNELISRGYTVDVGVVEIWTTDESGNRKKVNCEIDFVANRGRKKYYIQSALNVSDSVKEKTELRPLLGTNDFFRKIIVTKSNMKPWFDENGILHLGLYEFLLNESAVDF